LLPKEIRDWTNDFLIDIMTKDFLPTYLGWLDDEMESIMRRPLFP